MKTKLIILFFIFSGCAQAESEQLQPKSLKEPSSKHSVDHLVGAHSASMGRGLCEIYDEAAFGGVYFVERIETTVTKNKFGIEVPFSVVSFKRELAFDKRSPESFELQTEGGETASGQVTSADFDIHLGRTYAMFPNTISGGRASAGSLFIAHDSKFEEVNGVFKNDHMFNTGTKLNRTEFKAHFLKGDCLDVRPDSENMPRKGKSKSSVRSESKIEVGEK